MRSRVSLTILEWELPTCPIHTINLLKIPARMQDPYAYVVSGPSKSS